MHRLSLISLLLVSSLPAIAQSVTVSEVKAREEEFRQSELQYDTAAAAQILADDFVLISASDGKPHDKKWFLPLIGDRADPIEALEYGDMDVRVYGTSAVVISTVHEKFLLHGKSVEFRGPRTAVWVKIK
ncbi:nuclear transport factor 2 family protein [Tunturibacter psychrotolerans]|uniref:Nuclear transport factor 2 family protein n=1 Tax=Tunturiibacter psychrotolerans TaxID=3069686 RepID=A0AAU7ZRC5_9BACT